MSLRSPGWLLLLLPLAALIAAYVLTQRRRSRYAVRFTNLDLLDKVAPNRPGRRRHVPAAAFCAMLALLVVGFARPTAEVQVPRERATIVVAFDVSASMEATFALLGGLAIASLVIGWILSGRVLRPVRAISRTAAEIQATDLSQRIRLTGPKDELRELADTVDSMLDRLDEAFRAQRQLVDDASHELRSPLAIIRANVDAVLTSEESDEEERRAAARSVDRATTRMTRLVEDLLATARRNAPALADTDVDLAAAAGEACEEFAPLATERGLTLHRRLTPGLTVIGDHDALRRAVGNLLSNAVRLAPPGTRITVAAGRSDGWLWTAVRDEGPGILDDDQTRVFDRFWRARGNGGSRDRHAGLGLAIVRQIVESHGGQVRLFSRVGEGSTFVLWFPTTEDGRGNGGPPQTAPL
ncbi:MULTISPECIES: ATP-binding protein [Streptomyces]|uniref:sensor histidine kinase n=1 Tax=Streptomyces TaxID=1883 RepID=UPI0014899C05|nr:MULTISPECIES: ATP-binding protein [Streptomyces]